MNSRPLKIGTRGSDLALWQANHIQSVLKQNHQQQTKIKIIKTSGDKITDLSFDKMEGKGFFTKEIEDALLNGEIDVAVHSLKDLMTRQPGGLMLGAVGFRDDPRELLLIRPESYVRGGYLPVEERSVIGTSSARRQCQIAYHNRSLKIKDLRGNIPTRIQKLRDGEYDAIILAAAGVRRLGIDLSGLEVIYLAPEVFLPCPAQGILGLQIREGDIGVNEIIRKLDCSQTRVTIAMERGLLEKFDSGCSLPLGVYADIKPRNYRLTAVLGQKRDNVWRELIFSEIEGDNLQDIVNQTYRILTEEAPADGK